MVKTNKKKQKGQTIFYNTLHRKLKIQYTWTPKISKGL